jgi:hypothetical protein
MKQNSIAGSALIAAVLGFVLTMAFHPTGGDFAGGSEALARATHRAVGSHGLALVSIPAALFGFLGLSRWLGLRRAPVSAAFILYAVSSAALLCAALVSGFVAPDLIRERTAADPADRSAWHALLAYNFLLNQAFAKVGVAAFSGAMIFWSASLPRSGALARTAQVLGIAIGTATLLVLGHGFVRLDVRGFGWIVLSEAAWILPVAILLLRAPDRETTG